MKETSVALVLLGLCFILLGCQGFQHRPGSIPSSAIRVDGTFIDCTGQREAKKYDCTVYEQTTGEILADGLFVLSESRAADRAELQYAAYRANYLERFIVLKDSRTLTLELVSGRDPTIRLINDKLKTISSSGGKPATDCGETTTSRPEEKVSQCGRAAFENRKPFYVRYSRPGGIPYFSYGLAADAEGNVFEVVYDLRGLLNVALGKNAQVFDDNHIRVTACIKPVTLGRTDERTLACVTPINEKESALAAQQEPIETTVCAILGNPAAFNNKMVRIHGHVSGNFEYSTLDGDGCSGSIWFAYGNGSGPVGLVAYVTGSAEPGAQDSEGKRILPIPVKLVRDSNFSRFQRLMSARVKADERSLKSNPDELVSHCVTATFVGRVDGVSPEIHAFHLKRSPTDRADFLGFGQMGLFDAQFVVQSVVSDAVLGTCASAGGSP